MDNYRSMKVAINGETKELPDGISLNEMIEMLSLPPRMMAIEINQQVIRKQDWEGTRIDEGDKIEIVHFVGGG